jgi:ABC-type dipeptide/oligopeptide/nickel transport system permease component
MVAGGYYGLKYLKEKKMKALIGSALFCGLAIASTQKAAVGTVGLLLGISLVLLRQSSFKETLRVICTYPVIIFVSLLVVFSYLILISPENFSHFFDKIMKQLAGNFFPATKEVYPFPYKRYEFVRTLMFQNPLFYAFGIGGILHFP